jgi:UDP-N-acetylmuramate--L-alanine ligase/UDP-N-acetylenolpyruvoylglucosamine reductase
MKATTQLFSRPVSRIHCLGVGGMGLGPLAIYLAGAGFEVSGEDEALTPPMHTQLTRAGVTVGPLPAGCDLVVHTAAVPAGHPVLRAAVEGSIPFVRRGELLAEATRGRRLVAVCGSHGKTTTTAMLIAILRKAGIPAGYVLGGLFNDDSPPAAAGAGEWVVAEVDESDGTIDAFSPELTVAVNLDWDHPDHYREPREIEETFAALFRRTRGTVLVSDACAVSARIAPTARTFGRTGEFRAESAGETDGRQQVRLGGAFPALVADVRAAGEFNAANAAAALAAARIMGIALKPDLLADFPGVRRRQGALATAEPFSVIEDYAHHPAEIRALLGSLRTRPGMRRLIVVFQPHRFSRTARFKAEFAAALGLADRVHLLDVYGAGEAPLAGGTAADIYAEMKRQCPGTTVSYLPGGDQPFFGALDREVQEGDLVAFVGAGDIDGKARAWLGRRAAAGPLTGRWDDFVAAVMPVVSRATRIRREEPLAPRTTMRVGGAARVYAEPATAEDLAAIWRTARSAGLPVHLLGRGSNLIVPDEGVDGVVISLAHPAWSAFEQRPGGRVWVGAGLRLKNLCGLASAAGLGGFEFLEGIPGSVGGALRMNAGAMGGWFFDVVEEVQVLQGDGGIATLRRADMHVDYRHCAELHHAVALGALLRPAAPAEADAISRQIDTYRRKRHETQPREPSAGCIFRNPPGDSAGRLIDAAGLKGERVGEAMVSPVHANFIVNTGRATAADVLALVRRVRERVKETTGKELEPEALLFGREWRDVL